VRLFFADGDLKKGSMIPGSPGGFPADGRDDLFRTQYGLRLPIGQTSFPAKRKLCPHSEKIRFISVILRNKAF
jgi:hypothetical protein